MFYQYDFTHILSGGTPEAVALGYYRETDYLTLGYWWVSDYDYALTEGYWSDVGSFVTGGDLFNDNKMPIEGEATYQGLGMIIAYENTSKYITTSYIEAYWLIGDSSLSVDFRSGIISGTISNFLGGEHKANTDNYAQDLPGKLILNNAKIGKNHSGFFEGNLTGTFNGRSYNGLYGGQFYGNGESDGKPGTVAGTLGGISSDGRFTLTGYWMGDK